MSIPNPYTNPAPYGFVELGGSRMPGILDQVTYPDRTYEYAVQNGYGQTQVTIYRTTQAISGIKVRHFLATAADFDALRDVFMPLLIKGWPNTVVGRPVSFPFGHPDASFLGVRRVHLTNYSCPKQFIERDPSRWYEMTFQEDLPQKRIPVGPAEPAKLDGPPVPKDALEAALVTAVKDFQAGGGVLSLFGAGGG